MQAFGRFLIMRGTALAPSRLARTFSASRRAPNNEEPKQQSEAQPDKPATEASDSSKERAAPGDDDRMQALEAKVAELNDKYLRALAEMENVRIRARKDVEAARSFGIQSFAKALLEVSDNLDRAVAAAPEEDRKRLLYEGVLLTQKQLHRSFADNGLEQLNPVGEVFNADYHQALFEVADASKANGVVSVVTRTGFKLNGRILRPAQVGVVKNPPAAESA